MIIVFFAIISHLGNIMSLQGQIRFSSIILIQFFKFCVNSPQFVLLLKMKNFLNFNFKARFVTSIPSKV